MELIGINKHWSSDHHVAFETFPRISNGIEIAFAHIVAVKPEWRSPGFVVNFNMGVLFVSPASAATPEFMKTLLAILNEAEQANNAREAKRRAAEGQERVKSDAIIEAIAKALDLPIK